MSGGVSGGRTRRGPVRLTIVDDNSFIRDADGRVRPKAATFHRFAEAVVRAGPFGVARYVIPVRDARNGTGPDPRALGPVDESLLRIVPSAPFEGAAGYLMALPGMLRYNLPLLRRAVSGEHLVWIKLPASNGAAAALVADALGVARFSYVVGNVREVVGASPRSGPARVAALGAAALHDGIIGALTRTGPTVRLGAELFTSSFTAADLDQAGEGLVDPPASGGESSARGVTRLVWAGRMAPEKDLRTLLRAVTLLRAAGWPAQVTLIGDGPERSRLEAQARTLGISDAVTWLGYVGDRERYLAALRASDLFVLPSLSEGVPKVLVEAMACGLPVIASSAGAIPELLGGGRRGRLFRPGNEIDLAAAIRATAEDPAGLRRFRAAGVAWAADHTAERQAERLVAWMRTAFPNLPWPAEAPS